MILMHVLTYFKEKKKLVVHYDIFMGESTVLNKFIVMDDVSGLADKSKSFANFLTVSRKFSFTCV